MAVVQGEAVLNMPADKAQAEWPAREERGKASPARTGQRVDLEALLARHEGFVLRVAMQLLRHREDALDAAQEVFLRLHRYLATLDPERPAEPWLYRMTVNVCRDIARARRRWRAGPGLWPRGEAALPEAGRALDVAEGLDLVQQGLATLTERERAAVTLRDIEGLGAGEVAEAMGISQVTVRTLICRGRAKLKQFRDERMGRTYDE